MCRARLVFALLLCTLGIATACRSSKTGNESSPYGIVVVSAPVTGEVRRVLVGEGVAVSRGAAIVEIAVPAESTVASQSEGVNSRSRARADVEAAQQELASAQAQVERAAVEVQRVTPLVASGSAPQAQLDAAQAQYQRAQERLQKAQGAVQSTTGRLVAQQGERGTDKRVPSEQLVAARVPVSGVVRAINARPGQQVTAGQPLATVSADAR